MEILHSFNRCHFAGKPVKIWLFSLGYMQLHLCSNCKSACVTILKKNMTQEYHRHFQLFHVWFINYCRQQEPSCQDCEHANVITELLYHEILFLSSELPEGLDIKVLFGYYSILDIFTLVYSNLLLNFKVYSTLHKQMNLSIKNQPLSRLVFKFFGTKKNQKYLYPTTPHWLDLGDLGSIHANCWQQQAVTKEEVVKKEICFTHLRIRPC